MQSTTIIAFDQHAATTVAAVLVPGQRTPALHTLTSDSPTILRFVERLRRQGPLRCCYEAGPCGFELQRALTARQVPCDIIAPALIPRRAGDRIKTDRRDAGQLAVLYRAGALTAIHIPSEHEEAARDLLRCREDIRADLLRARHRLSKFLLRHGRRFTATKKAWSKRHDAWLRAQTWPIAALDQTHRAYLRAVDEVLARLRDVEQDLRALLDLDPLHSRVQRLRCFRGIDDLTALTIAAELGDPRRFATARAPWPSSASSRPSTRAARNGPKAASPKPATPICVGSSWNRRGTIATIRLSAPPSARASAGRRRTSLRARGRLSSGCIVVISGSPRAGNPNNTL
jgi:transposase